MGFVRSLLISNSLVAVCYLSLLFTFSSPAFCGEKQESISTRCAALINPIQRFAFEYLLKACLFTRADISKEFTKLVLPYLVNKKIFAHCGSYQITSDHLIAYGCEAAWAGYYDGIDMIPQSLLRYALVDVCYLQMQHGAHYCGFDYPHSIKQHYTVYNLMRVLLPLFCKRCIGSVLDACIENGNHDETVAVQESYV